PVDRSMTVSAPRWTAVWSFSSSSSILLVTAELPMLALILHADATPMPIGSSRLVRWTLLAGITIRPRATSERISSGSRSSRCATKRISSVIWPWRAASNCVMEETPCVYQPCREQGAESRDRAEDTQVQRPRGFAFLRRYYPDQVPRVCSQTTARDDR